MEEVRGQQHVVLEDNHVGVVVLFERAAEGPSVVLRQPGGSCSSLCECCVTTHS